MAVRCIECLSSILSFDGEQLPLHIENNHIAVTYQLEQLGIAIVPFAVLSLFSHCMYLGLLDAYALESKELYFLEQRAECQLPTAPE